MTTDPIADLLTRIRNAGMAEHATAKCPNSKTKTEICRVLKDEGYIEDYSHEDGLGAGTLQVRLKYHRGDHVITGLKRESKPGRRCYVSVSSVPEVLNGLGVAILTTSKGVMTGRDAAAQGVGGEYLCSVW